jgi:hypothetical protein
MSLELEPVFVEFGADMLSLSVIENK